MVSLLPAQTPCLPQLSGNGGGTQVFQLSEKVISHLLLNACKANFNVDAVQGEIS